jgi:hypothetical protein
LDAARREVRGETTTDANGYYAFDRPAGEVGPAIHRQRQISIHRRKTSATTTATQTRIPSTDETRPFVADATAPFHDAGVILLERPIATSSPVVTGTPENWFFPQEPYIGPIRSGRMTYRQVNYMFWNSCLVFASAGRGIIDALDACAVIYGVDENTPNSSLLPVTRLRQLAEESLKSRDNPSTTRATFFRTRFPQAANPRQTSRSTIMPIRRRLGSTIPSRAVTCAGADMADGTWGPRSSLRQTD